MIAYYINSYSDGTYHYYDMIVENAGEQVIRLGGINFEKDFTEKDLVERAIAVITEIVPDCVIEGIYIGYADYAKQIG